MKQLKGHITISRPRGLDGDHISIQLQDSLSGITFCQARLSLAEFAQCLTGLGYTDCEFDFYPSNVGKVLENKTELVALGTKYTVDEKVAAIAKFEVDGWVGRQEDVGNWHKRSKKDDGWHVGFRRFVEVVE